MSLSSVHVPRCIWIDRKKERSSLGSSKKQQHRASDSKPLKHPIISADIDVNVCRCVCSVNILDDYASSFSFSFFIYSYSLSLSVFRFASSLSLSFNRVLTRTLYIIQFQLPTLAYDRLRVTCISPTHICMHVQSISYLGKQIHGRANVNGAHFGTQKILAGKSTHTHTYAAVHWMGNCKCALNGMEWSVMERRNKPREL